MIDRLRDRRNRFYDTWQQDWPCLIVYSRNRLYLSDSQRPGVLLITPDESTYFSTRVHDVARDELSVDQFVAVSGMGEALDEIDSRLTEKRIGLELGKIPASLRDRIVDHLELADAADVTRSLRETRMIKDPFERDKLREAARQSDEAHKMARKVIESGKTELEVASKIEGAAREAGHEGIMTHGRFDAYLPYGLIASGDNLSRVGSYAYVSHGSGPTRAFPISAGHRQIEPDDPVIVDIGGVHYGYNADVSRTYIAGNPSPKLSDAYQALEGVYQRIEDQLQAGVTAEHLYRVGDEAASGTPFAANFQGYGEQRGRFVGHGIGLEIDEPPVLSPGNQQKLPAGVAVTIEIQFIFPENGAVKIEESCLVESDGVEILSSIPRKLYQTPS